MDEQRIPIVFPARCEVRVMESGAIDTLHDDLRWRIAELDFGDSPSGMLVIREALGSRIAGMILSLLIGIPVTWCAAIVFVKYHDIGAAIIFALFGVSLLLGGLWLLWQLLYSNYFYAAIDDQWFIRRTGSRRLLTIPLSELGPFFLRRGSLRVKHLPTGRTRMVIKDAYAPERLDTLMHRLNVWRAAPPAARPQQMQSVDRIDLQRTRTRANRLIVNGLIAVLLLPALITLTVKFNLFGAAWGWQVFSWGLGTFYGLASLFLGLLLRLTSRRRAEPQTVDAGTELSP